MKVTIRPNSISGHELQIEVRPFGTGARPLDMAARALCDTIGLVLVNSNESRDTEGREYLSFTIGTGREFIAFVSL